MKKEINLNWDKRHGKTASDLIKTYRMLGYTDEEIKQELQKILDNREKIMLKRNN